ncbi:MAG: HEAT repeat domain-containing protein [Acidimicrobiales bacterium]
MDRRLYRLALKEVAASVSGDGAALVEQAAREMGLFERAARWCRSRRWSHRLRGVRSFGPLGGGGDLVPARLGDAHPLVREAAARWVARHPSPAPAERLVAMLDDRERRCRLAAEDALIRLGATAAEPLAASLSPEACPGRALALAK